ncbi:hypothetical protein [Vagococcus xieshaowenii]|uniref:Uncharacterized protein n=1 Tax=Vagococcus xieshaowenii TaxID=2562451 RepID=A0AAJ5EFX0_9ENTE|nr:hypothetical protein [Vagococcus xieshaowenii]QCA29193.1 hypothetical protein E4Z98_07635 [Vagococcus xieshaowenii]TFZ40829.1 hypothetical protein E4031_05455 [Vagococcus xieshaowenii]
MYHTYLVSNSELTEIELETEVLSIKEALEKDVVSQDFFDSSELSDEELNAPNGIMVLKNGYGIAIQRYEDEELSAIFKKDYLYEIQLVADEPMQVAKVYGLLFDYLKTCSLPIEIWEAKAGLEEYVEGKTQELSQMKASDLEALLESEHHSSTRRVNLI